MFSCIMSPEMFYLTLEQEINFINTSLEQEINFINTSKKDNLSAQKDPISLVLWQLWYMLNMF